MSDGDRDQEEGVGLEAAFDAASQYVGVASSSGTLTDTHLLRFYGLYKQATAGACTAPKPSLFDRRGRAKWHAWQACSALSSSQAQQEYVALLSEAAPGWAGAASSSDGGGGSSGGAAKRPGGVGGAVQSRMAAPTEDDGEVRRLLEDAAHPCLGVAMAAALVVGNQALRPHLPCLPHQLCCLQGPEALPPLLQAARAGNAAAVEQLLQQGDDANQAGSEGERALHWAADRGHLAVLRLLLERGADVNAADCDGLTPLHYTALAEQAAAAEALAEAPGARLDLRSAEGETAAEVAPASWSFLHRL
jgi:acyl-CoA-binding protein